MRLIGAAVIGVLLLLSTEFREDKKELRVLIVAFFLCAGLLYWSNKVFDADSLQLYSAVVDEKKHKAFRLNGSTYERYFCTVVLEDGGRYYVQTQSDIYDDLKEGEEVVLRIYSGALGMKYGEIGVN